MDVPTESEAIVFEFREEKAEDKEVDRADQKTDAAIREVEFGTDQRTGASN